MLLALEMLRFVFSLEPILSKIVQPSATGFIYLNYPKRPKNSRGSTS
jgi:hypothetical protein